MNNKKIALGITGSFCTFSQIIENIKELVKKENFIQPVFSYSLAMDTRFYKSADFKRDIEAFTGNIPITTITEAEPIGPKNDLDLVIIAPCTGNTLAKLAAGITDTPVLMAAKAHLRNDKPLLLAVSTNDALSANHKNIAELLNRKNIYFVPYRQDDYLKKKNSLVADFSLLEEAADHAIAGRQMQPLLIKD